MFNGLIHKNRLVALLLAVLLSGLLLSACSQGKTEPKLSELEDGELLQTMTSFGVTLPEGVGMDTVRSMVAELEEDPDHEEIVAVDWTPIADLYEDIREMVVEYQSNGK